MKVKMDLNKGDEIITNGSINENKLYVIQRKNENWWIYLYEVFLLKNGITIK